MQLVLDRNRFCSWSLQFQEHTLVPVNLFSFRKYPLYYNPFTIQTGRKMWGQFYIPTWQPQRMPFRQLTLLNQVMCVPTIIRMAEEKLCRIMAVGSGNISTPAAFML